MEKNKYIFETRNLTKNFKVNKQYVNIYNNFNIKIKLGSITSILGNSGCGKTTLARIFAGLEKYEFGEIYSLGIKVENPSIDRMLIMQDLGLFDWLTVKQNILFGLQNFKLEKSIVEKRYKEILSFFGLEGFDDFFISQISGGMKQRVALARAMIVEPKVLILDEPFSSIDEYNKLNIINLLLKLNKIKNISIIFITHNISEAIYLSDEVIMLKRENNLTKIHKVFEIDNPKKDVLSFLFSKSHNKYLKIILSEFIFVNEKK